MLKSQMVRALAPKEPVISQDDVDRWNATEDRSKANEEAIARLQKELQLLDGPKIKADILQLFKVQANFVNKDVLTSLQEEIRRAKQEVADLAYEL